MFDLVVELSAMHKELKAQEQKQSQLQWQLVQTFSASSQRLSEDVRIQALVIAKLELVDVEMQVLLADLMKCPTDAAFHDGPESFNGIGMHRIDDILTLRVIDGLMWILFAQLPIPECDG